MRMTSAAAGRRMSCLCVRPYRRRRRRDDPLDALGEKERDFSLKRFEPDADGQGTRRERREESLDRSMSFNQIRRYEEEFDDRCREKEREKGVFFDRGSISMRKRRVEF